MLIQFPSRLGWLLILLITFLLLHSGCTPIQPPAQYSSPLAPEDVIEDAEDDNSNDANPNLPTTHVEESTSPDGEWVATATLEMTVGEKEYTQSLIVEHQSGSPRYVLVAGAFPSGLGYTVVTPLAWSKDNVRFYYTNRAQADGCGLFNNGSDLYRVDLATGETRELLPPSTSTVLGLAPNEQVVAYRAVGEPALIIRNLMTGDYASFDIEPLLGPDQIDQLGSIVWSPDSKSFAFAIAHKPCSGGWAEATSIYVLELNDMSVMPHLQQDDRLLVPVAWSTPDQLQLQNEQDKPFTLDLMTNAVTPQ